MTAQAEERCPVCGGPAAYTPDVDEWSCAGGGEAGDKCGWREEEDREVIRIMEAAMQAALTRVLKRYLANQPLQTVKLELAIAEAERRLAAIMDSFVEIEVEASPDQNDPWKVHLKVTKEIRRPRLAVPVFDEPGDAREQEDD